MNRDWQILLDNGGNGPIESGNATSELPYVEHTARCWCCPNPHLPPVVLSNICPDAEGHPPSDIRQISLQSITSGYGTRGKCIGNNIDRTSPNNSWLVDSTEKLICLWPCPCRILFCCGERSSHVMAIPRIVADQRPT